MRQSHQDLPKRVVPANHVDLAFPNDLWEALESYREEIKGKRAPTIRALLAAQLRATGHLAPLLRPEDAIHLLERPGYPWSPMAAYYPPNALVWWSQDPSRLTWATLLNAMEHERQTTLVAICARHGISVPHAQRIFKRYDHWRRGEDHRPRLDPFAGSARLRNQKRRKPNAKNG